MKAELPPASELEGALRNGVIVARLAMFFAPELVKQRQIYDFDEAIFKVRCARACMRLVGLGLGLGVRVHTSCASVRVGGRGG